MTPHAGEILRRLDALDALLADRGQHRMSPWWRSTLGDFYESGVRSLVLRVGRRGGKSTTFCRLAVCEALFGDHTVPMGEVGIVGIVSIRREEATDRLRQIESLLKLLGVRHRRSGDTIDLHDRPMQFRVMTASLGGVVGGSWVCGILDEVARWRDVDLNVNPASQIIESVRPTLATMPNARLVISSSPLGTADAHFDLCEVGDGPAQIVRIAPTWVANDSLSEADTRALEPDEIAWRREFAAIPQQEHETSLLTEGEVDRATRSEPVEVAPEDGVSYIAATDPATRGDGWSLAIAGMRRTAVGLRRSIVKVAEWRGSRQAPLSPREVFGKIATILRPYRIDHLYSDQASGDALTDLAADVGLSLIVEPTTATNRVAMYENLRQRIRADEVELPPDATVKADLLAVRKRISRAGVSLELPHVGGRHCDHAASIALALSKYLAEPVVAKPRPRVGSPQWLEADRERRRRDMIERTTTPADRGRHARWRQR